ncbi:MAG: threonylcarbamoyl-AMP synthase, partial [Candidatus Omnitrophica bacterium]|nr:threonylcarbamoyl-AMP synthase [Candidatus Omnitrophota bacterium]
MASPKIVSASDPRNIEAAASLLKKGGLVAFPTETVYGLGADAFNTAAVCRVFEVKKRPQFDPLIVHVGDPQEVRRLWQAVPPSAEELIRRFWPGPLTLVLPKTENVPDIVTAGLSTVAVRMPKNRHALTLIECFGRPIAAPSANLYGYTSPTSAQAVLEDLGGVVDLILDGGLTEVGIESTVLKIESGKGVLLRPGGVSKEELLRILPVSESAGPDEGVCESPGLARSHYAPWTGLWLVEDSYAEFVKELAQVHKVFEEKKVSWPRLGLLSFAGQKETALFESVEVLSPTRDLTEAAARLFGSLRKLD